MTDETTGVNVPLLRKVLDHVTAHPDEWDQSYWATQTGCGTAYCIAGHAVTMAGLEVMWSFNDPGDDMAHMLKDGRQISDVAAQLLGIPPQVSLTHHMFAATNDLRTIYTLANRYTGGEIEIPDELPDGS